MVKRRKPLKCKTCGKKFSFSANSHPLSRLNKHRWKAHPTQAKRSLSKGKKKKKQLLDEMELTDDILLRQIQQLKGQYAPQQPYQAEHNIAIGALIEGVMLGVEIAKGIKGIAKTVKKAKVKKK